MRRNEAHKLTFENQIDGEPMESRIARIEADVAHINSTLVTVQADVRELRTDLRNGLAAANEAIAEVKRSVTALGAKFEGQVTALDAKCEGQFTALRAEIRATASALESKLIMWIIGTMIACTSVALTIAKTVH